MASTFTACPKCGVRLSAPSMAYHQQLCGKPQQHQSTATALPIQYPLSPANPINVAPTFPTRSTSQQQPSRLMEAGTALRQDVYGAPSPATPLRGYLPQQQQQQHQQQQMSSRQEYPPPANNGYWDAADFNVQPIHERSSSGRGASQHVPRDHADDRSDDDDYSRRNGRPAPRTSASQRSESKCQTADSQQTAETCALLHQMVLELQQTVEEHVLQTQGDISSLSNLCSRQKLQRIDEMQMREDLQRMADELLGLRRDLKDVSNENEKLRDEVRKLKSERSVVAADSDFIELRNEVVRLKGQVDVVSRDSYAHVREARSIRDEMAEDTSTLRKDCRNVSRLCDTLRDDVDSLRKLLSDRSEGASDKVPRSSSNLQRPNINLTVQHVQKDNGTSATRRSPSAASRARSVSAQQNRIDEVTQLSLAPPRDSEPDAYEEASPIVHREYLYKAAPVVIESKSRKPQVRGALQAQSATLDSSLLTSQRETESLVTKAFQTQRKPSAVVSSRSLSRTTANDDAADYEHRDQLRGDSASPQDYRHAPVAHVSLKHQRDR